MHPGTNLFLLMTDYNHSCVNQNLITIFVCTMYTIPHMRACIHLHTNTRTHARIQTMKSGNTQVSYCALLRESESERGWAIVYIQSKGYIYMYIQSTDLEYQDLCLFHVTHARTQARTHKSTRVHMDAYIHINKHTNAVVWVCVCVCERECICAWVRVWGCVKK